MKKRITLISVCLSLAVLGACQRSETTAAVDTDTSAGTVTASAAPAAAPYDLQFIDSMTKHHQMAVDIAKAGGPKFGRKPLKDLAMKMSDDQTKEIAQLRQWRDQWYPGAAAAENMSMPGMSSSGNMDMSHMQTMSGNALDMMFIDMMTPHHERAIAMAQDALAKAEHQEIKSFAQNVIDAQKKEIDQMQQWKKAWAK